MKHAYLIVSHSNTINRRQSTVVFRAILHLQKKNRSVTLSLIYNTISMCFESSEYTMKICGRRLLNLGLVVCRCKTVLNKAIFLMANEG